MKPKLLILYNRLLHYRLPIFNILAQKYDVTVAYNYGSEPNFEYQFERLKLHPFKLWRFTLQKENVFKICQKYDIVLAYGETSYLKYSFLSLHPKRNFRLIYWNIGAPASYTRHYGDGTKLYYAYTHFFQRRADAHISYAEAGREIHIQHGFNPRMLFVANNTVEVKHLPKYRARNSIMFIGTLYPQKGIHILLDAYKSALKEYAEVLPLNIVGTGILFENIKNWINDNNLSNRVKMVGALYTSEEKSPFFEKAYACISPNQAGLAVLECMGYGVAFVTSNNAITGGEVFNIVDGVNGIRLDDLSLLKDIIIDISKHPDKYKTMGETAYDHYWTCRKPEDMADGLIEAIEYVRNK